MQSVERFYRKSESAVAKSTVKPTARIRAALTLRNLSVRKLAQKHGVSDKTLYAALAGDRPGRNPRVRLAVAEAKRAAESLADV